MVGYPPPCYTHQSWGPTPSPDIRPGDLKLKHVRFPSGQAGGIHPTGMLSCYELYLYIFGLGKIGLIMSQLCRHFSFTNTRLWMQLMKYPVFGFVQI